MSTATLERERQAKRTNIKATAGHSLIEAEKGKRPALIQKLRALDARAKQIVGRQKTWTPEEHVQRDTELEETKKLRLAVERELNAVNKRITEMEEVNGQLRSAKLTNPKLLEALKVRRSRVDCAQQRTAAATLGFQKIKEHNAGIVEQCNRLANSEGRLPGDFDRYSQQSAQQLAEAQAELDDALACEAEAIAEVARIKKAIIDE